MRFLDFLKKILLFLIELIFSSIFNELSYFLSFSEYIRPFLNHNFQNVRQQLSGLLSNIFKTDLKFANASEPQCPRVKDFISEVVQKMHAHCTGKDFPKLCEISFYFYLNFNFFQKSCEKINKNRL